MRMLNMEVFLLALLVLLTAVLSVATNNISEQCQVHNERRITCSCIGNEEFFLPEAYNYVNVTSVSVTSCASANLHYSSLTEANHFEEMIVQNISGRLDFEIFFTSHRLKLLRLSNIGKIPIITRNTFMTLVTIDTLEFEDAIIENFKEDFTNINVLHFIVTNVTIERMDRLNFSEKGTMLRIVNSELRNIATSLNFANFLNIEIINSKFELQKPGLVSIQSDVTLVKHSVFSNVSMNLVAANAITIIGICADGKSTLRLSSKYINSADNRLPNEIAYPRDNQHGKPEFFMSRNNTVCKAGNCKCPKSNGQVSYENDILIFIFGCLLIALLSKDFY